MCSMIMVIYKPTFLEIMLKKAEKNGVKISLGIKVMNVDAKIGKTKLEDSGIIQRDLVVFAKA